MGANITRRTYDAYIYIYIYLFNVNASALTHYNISMNLSNEINSDSSTFHDFVYQDQVGGESHTNGGKFSV